MLLNANDPASDPLTTTLASQAQNGTVTVNADGSFTYVPNAGFIGTDSFSFTVSDGVLTSAPATVTLTVKPDNTPPVSVDQSYSVMHDSILGVNASSGVLSNAGDADGDPLLAQLVTGPANGTLTLNLDGSFQYLPNSGYAGADSFTYQAFDGTTVSNTSTVSLTVLSSAPLVVNENYGVHAGQALVVAAPGLLAGAQAADNQPLTTSLVTGASDGTVTVNADGSFSYVPNAGFTGTDSFVYDVSDGTLSTSGTVFLNIHSTNTTPVVTNLNYSSLHDRSLTVPASTGVLAGATDADGDPLTATLVSGSGPSDGTVTLNPDGSFTYTPNAGFTGTDSFQFAANDGLANSSAGTASIAVTDPNAPVAGPRVTALDAITR